MEPSPPANRAIPQSKASSAQAEAESAQAEAAFLEARLCWRRLYSEPDCLTDPEKRRAMLPARLRYQDAKLDWFFRFRASNGLRKLYADVLADVKDDFLGLTVADVAEVHRKMKEGASPNGLVNWAVARYLRDHLDAEDPGRVL